MILKKKMTQLELMLNDNVDTCKRRGGTSAKKLGETYYCPYSRFKTFDCQHASRDSSITIDGIMYRYCKYPKDTFKDLFTKK